MTEADGVTGTDRSRRAGLRRMRTVAVGLLLLAAVVYAVTLDRAGALGFVNATAEAAMVGAVADWFAVTALFRHPLGIPVPHTALIPRRKQMLARSLEEFVAESFLAEDVVRDRVLSADVSARVGRWLTDDAHSARVVDEAAALVSAGLAQVRDEDVALLVEEVLVPRLREEPVAPVLGSLLAEVVAENAHHGLVDLALDEGHRWLLDNEETFCAMVADRAPWWAPQRVNDVVSGRLYTEAVRWLTDIRDDPRHPARAALDDALGRLAHDLLHDPETQQRAERVKHRLLVRQRFIDTGVSLGNALRRALADSLAEPDGPVRRRGVDELVALGGRLSRDRGLGTRLNGYAADLAAYLVRRYGRELTAVITHTVDRWDGRETADRIELHVGRDLQFIRVNGTVVGGLVGLLIHTVSVLVP